MYLSPEANDTWVVPPRSTTNFLPFLSGSGEKRQLHKSRWTGFGSEQPEFVARNTATPKSVPRKNRDINPIELKFLRSRGFFQEAPCGFGQSPRSYGLGQSPRSSTSKLFHSLWKSVWEKAKSGGKLLRDGGFRPVLRENGRKREEKSLWKNERLDFSARVMYNI